MPQIHEVATLTFKGQITLPHPIPQVPGGGTGGKVGFDLGAVLGLLEKDVRIGRHIQSMPEGLARAMVAGAKHGVNSDDDIEGDVAL